jgi:hypothetical protein
MTLRSLALALIFVISADTACKTAPPSAREPVAAWRITYRVDLGGSAGGAGMSHEDVLVVTPTEAHSTIGEQTRPLDSKFRATIESLLPELVHEGGSYAQPLKAAGSMPISRHLTIEEGEAKTEIAISEDVKGQAPPPKEVRSLLALLSWIEFPAAQSESR